MSLLDAGEQFVDLHNLKGWVKLPNRRLNTPDYSRRAVFEALVNAFIHRDYSELGSEVHIDIYDDRLVIYSPGGMFDGTLIQDRDLDDISSKRRNPILADVFAQLDFMEREEVDYERYIMKRQNFRVLLKQKNLDSVRKLLPFILNC